MLVGGDTYDYHNNLRRNAISFVPSLYTYTGDIVSFAPADALYADIDDDRVPDLAIGRLPVRTSSELAQSVNKILSYQTRDYSKTALFAADRYDFGQQYSFRKDADKMISALPADWQSGVVRAYVDDLGTEDARLSVIQSINLGVNRGDPHGGPASGVALTSYVGHSGPKDWSFEGLFTAQDALALNNAGRPTVVIQWGCWNTYYVAPTEDTLGHSFMLHNENGAATLLGASTLTRATAEQRLAMLLYPKLFQPGVTLGEAVLAAKRSYVAQYDDSPDVILGWTILGDPALRLGE